MLRRLSLLAILAAATTLPAGGCRSCDSCHDYDSPVMNCNCGSCGYERSGSAAAGYVATSDEAPALALADDELAYE